MQRGEDSGKQCIMSVVTHKTKAISSKISMRGLECYQSTNIYPDTGGSGCDLLSCNGWVGSMGAHSNTTLPKPKHQSTHTHTLMHTLSFSPRGHCCNNSAIPFHPAIFPLSLCTFVISCREQCFSENLPLFRHIDLEGNTAPRSVQATMREAFQQIISRISQS